MSSFSVNPKMSFPSNVKVPFRKKAAFRIDTIEVPLFLDLAMATALGEFILDHHPENPAIAALGHQLLNIYGDSDRDYDPREQQE